MKQNVKSMYKFYRSLVQKKLGSGRVSISGELGTECMALCRDWKCFSFSGT